MSRRMFKKYDDTLYQKMKKEKRTIHRRNWLVKKNGTLSSVRSLSELSSYNYFLQKQENCCGICGKKQVDEVRDFAIDHDHDTGIVRGLLCFKCNSGIALLQEDVDILRSAIKYLELDEFVIRVNNRYRHE